jgi:O-antigen/teichoic acid export membrane protein
VPEFGMEGSAVASVTAYVVLFVTMTLWAQRIYPVPYQWRRVATALAAAVALLLVGKALDVPLAAAIGLGLLYPVVLLPLGFYSAAERARLRRLVPMARG